jgi:putative PIN family toxin of toxin-antitoxin system
MRVVFDTNVVVSRFLAPMGVPAKIFGRWRTYDFDLLLSEPILAEFQRVLAYQHIQAKHHMTDSGIADVIDEFRRFAILVEPTVRLEIIKADPDDNKFLECAATGNANYIVSGDLHLLSQASYQGVQILSPSVFLALL